MGENCIQFIALENLSQTHNNQPSRPLVCDTCAGKGYSTRDTHTYVCYKCKNVSGGHGLFQSKGFQRAAKRGIQKQVLFIAPDRLYPHTHKETRNANTCCNELKDQMSEVKLWHHASARDNCFVNPHSNQSADGITALTMMRQGSSISEVRG